MKADKLIVYMHAGSGNHGCEAIVNSLCHMIKEKVKLISYFGEEDERYSLKELCEIRGERRFENHKAAHVLYYGYRKLTGDKESFIRYRYGDVFKKEAAPLAISIGGDNYCYENMLGDLRLANSAFNRRGTRTVLLGCSIEPELLLGKAGAAAQETDAAQETARRKMAEDMNLYDLIIARESITYDALKKVVPEEKLRLVPDPAFTLGTKELPLPEGFAAGNTVGMNVSPMIRDSETKAGITMASYRALVEHIIRTTDMQIALIPHVVWDRNDDRKPLKELYDEFRTSKRVVLVGDASCEELKGYIARCRMFIGARTHATIAAYSQNVPTLVVGYSVKARGIARDLFGTEENYVLPVQSLKKPEDLVAGFSWLSAHEREIKRQLETVMPDYQRQAYKTGKEVDRLWEEFSRLQGI